MDKKAVSGVTIAKIAQIVGTSKMTVSRVVNNKGNVADSTRERIEQVIRELDYSPNVFARNLATNKTGIIGLIADNDAALAAEFRSIILGVESEASRNDYDVLFMFDRRTKGTAQHFRRNLVEGVIYFGNQMSRETIEYFENNHIPYVLIGKRRWAGYRPDYCSADYHGGYLEATRHLLSLGHRQIAMIGGFLDFPADELKFQGYWEALQEAGIDRNPALEVTEDRLEATAQLLEQQAATALIVNGGVAWNKLLEIITERQYVIPRDFSLILSGLNIDYNGQTIHYLLQLDQMSHLKIPDFDMGTQAARRLLQKLSGQETLPAENYLSMPFIKGDSCRKLEP